LRTEPQKIRVVILDTLPLWVAALEELAAAAGMRVVGTATETDAALDLVAELKPDLLISGIDTDDGGVDLTIVREARALAPDVKVFVISQRSDPGTIASAFTAGANVHALKNANPSDLVAAMRQIFKQSIFVAGQWASGAKLPLAQLEGGPELTPRELEILKLVAEGHTNRAMAAMLWVTDQTIKFHLSNIYRKLDVSNRTEAARWAQVHGLLHMADLAGPRMSERVA
jgi:DNA-binding NarL/FixJ family response regulator